MTLRTTWSPPVAPPGRQVAAGAGRLGRLARRVFHVGLQIWFPRRRHAVKQRWRAGRSQLVFANEHGGRKILLGVHSRAELALLRSVVEPEDTCLDVGAYMGHFTNMFAAAAPKGRVIAFEPVPQNARLIELNAAINQDSHVRVISAVATDEERHVALAREADSGFSRVQSSSTTGADVPGVTIDAIVAGGAVDIVKIDVEGHELQVLKGMVGVLSDAQRRPRLILAELVPQYLADYGASVEEVFAFLGQFGYRAELLGPAGRRVSVTAEQVGAGANVVFTLADAQRRPRD